MSDNYDDAKTRDSASSGDENERQNVSHKKMQHGSSKNRKLKKDANIQAKNITQMHMEEASEDIYKNNFVLAERVRDSRRSVDETLKHAHSKCKQSQSDCRSGFQISVRKCDLWKAGRNQLSKANNRLTFDRHLRRNSMRTLRTAMQSVYKKKWVKSATKAW